MNCIKMLKFTLSALLLTATTAAFAQGEQGEVTLKDNKTVVSWAQFVNAINDPSSIKGAVSDDSDVAKNLKEKDFAYNTTAKNDSTTKFNAAAVCERAYNTANDRAGEIQREISLLQSSTEKNPEDWLKAAYQSALRFQTAYAAVLASDTYNENGTKIWFKKQDGRATALYLSFTVADGYTEYGETQFYDELAKVSNMGALYIYLGDGYKGSVDGLLKVNGFSANKNQIIDNAVAELRSLIAEGTYDQNAKKLAKLRTELEGLNADENTEGSIKYLKAAWDTAKSEYDKAVQDTKTASNEYSAALAAYNNAAAAAGLANYKEVKLNADVTADVAINDFDGFIDGQSHTIAVTAPQLFTSYRGRLVNVGVNGNLAQSIAPTAISNNVVYWDNANNQGASYDSKGNETECATIGALGFAARRSFGVDFTNNKLVALTDASKVYSITVYEPNKEPVQKYVQVVNSELKEGAETFTIPTNMFIKSETTDLKGFDNVFFNDGTCEKVVITDRKQFYCPQTINAKEVVYDREFNEGYNAVCLPFELSSNANENIKILSTYDKETDEKFWFKKIAETVPANKPMLLVANAPFTLDLHNVQLAATPAEQKVGDDGNAKDGSKAWGIFKNVTREEFNGGASEAHKVYGLTAAEGKFYPAADGSHFPAFRMVIYSNEKQPAAVQKARKIAIVDEKGVEITDITTSAIDTTVASELEITTAPGEIIITSESDLGEVAVYSMDGRVAGITNVKAGIAASVEVQPGIYVVMGKKVMVK